MNKSTFFNQSFDKKRLKALIEWVLTNYGEKEALRVIEELKTTGFQNATQAGISLGINELKTPPEKAYLISKAQIAMNRTDYDFQGARITATEKSQRIVDTWHRVSETLRKQVVEYFSTYDKCNPIYIMALSGARGNFSQVRQLVGMRGLMADPQGEIISFPIRSNLREGLTLTEYFISCSGARKGLVDTALRTADTGYLTRRLVDVSHHVVIKRVACDTHRGIIVSKLRTQNTTLLSLKERLVGRVLAEQIVLDSQDGLLLSKEKGSKTAFLQNREGVIANNTSQTALRTSKDILNSDWQKQKEPSLQKYRSPFELRNKLSSQKKREAHLYKTTGTRKDTASQNLLARRDQEISPYLASLISLVREQVHIRSPLTCALHNELCQLCYGWSLSGGNLVPLGEAVGVIAAQSIGEPGTQLTMRTFHTGGVFSGDLLQEIRAPHPGRISFSKAFQGLLIRSTHGEIAFLTKTPGEVIITTQLTDTQDLSCATSEYPHQGEKKESYLGGEKSQQNQIKEALPQKSTKTALVTNISSLEKKAHLPKTMFRESRLFFQSLSMLFVRQGERVEHNQLIAEVSNFQEQGNQPIKSQQTVFAELSGQIIDVRRGTLQIQDVDQKEDIHEENEILHKIEADKSAKLGLFQIVATRIGATSDFYAFSHRLNRIKTMLSREARQRLQYLATRDRTMLSNGTLAAPLPASTLQEKAISKWPNSFAIHNSVEQSSTTMTFDSEAIESNVSTKKVVFSQSRSLPVRQKQNRSNQFSPLNRLNAQLKLYSRKPGLRNSTQSQLYSSCVQKNLYFSNRNTKSENNGLMQLYKNCFALQVGIKKKYTSGYCLFAQTSLSNHVASITRQKQFGPSLQTPTSYKNKTFLAVLSARSSFFKAQDLAKKSVQSFLREEMPSQNNQRKPSTISQIKKVGMHPHKNLFFPIPISQVDAKSRSRFYSQIPAICTSSIWFKPNLSSSVTDYKRSMLSSEARQRLQHLATRDSRTMVAFAFIPTTNVQLIYLLRIQSILSSQNYTQSCISLNLRERRTQLSAGECVSTNSFYLKTLAEEGDLVNQDYKEYTNLT